MVKSNYSLSENEINLINNWIKNKGIWGAINYVLEEMDCTKDTEIGRIMQTINVRYDFLIAAYYYMANTIIDADTKKKVMTTLDKRHNDNLLFEANNGTIIYDKKKRKTTEGKRIATSIRSKDIITGEDVIIPLKKEIVKERKLKTKAEKLKNGFTFNIAK